MIILFGSTGYVGSEFAAQLKTARIPTFFWPNTHTTTFSDLQKWYKNAGCPIIDCAINAAGYTGKPNVDACEFNKAHAIHGNIVWPTVLTDWCIVNDITLGHVSSGCIYSGKKSNGDGFTEEDEPNFTWTQNNCSFYSGTKAMAEQIVGKWEKSYIWRLRIPFEQYDSVRNYITKMLRYPKLLEAENSISNKQEFVSACIETLNRKVPRGIYNITNTGYITTSDLIKKLQQTIAKYRKFELIDEIELYRHFAKTPRSNCVMDNSKLLSTGIKMRTVNDSIDYCLKNWTVAP